MSDLNGDDLAKIGLSGAGGIGILYGLIKWLGTRNLDALDKSIGGLTAGVASLTAEIHALREANVAIVKDLGALQEGQKGLTARVDGQATYWRAEFDSLRRQFDDFKAKRK